MPTLGNCINETEIFFNSLVNQSYKQFELIVIDQSSDDTIKSLCDNYNHLFHITYVKHKNRGLSLNRNKGLKLAKGNIVAFPDDDCEYPDNILQKVVEFFNNNLDYNIVVFNSIDKSNGIRISKSLDYSTNINVKNFLKTAISITIFIKPIDITDIYFDEKLGIGAQFGACEESDMLLSLLTKRYKGYYFSNIDIYHPSKHIKIDNKRAYNYALGFGAFFKKAIFHYRNHYMILMFIYILIRNIGGFILSKHKSYYYYYFKGRIKGFMTYSINKNK
jgi:glycosyltransferase involved in cell wall biosynthesis